jgi:hypothetical protein
MADGGCARLTPRSLMADGGCARLTPRSLMAEGGCARLTAALADGRRRLRAADRRARGWQKAAARG